MNILQWQVIILVIHALSNGKLIKSIIDYRFRTVGLNHKYVKQSILELVQTQET